MIICLMQLGDVGQSETKYKMGDVEQLYPDMIQEDINDTDDIQT